MSVSNFSNVKEKWNKGNFFSIDWETEKICKKPFEELLSMKVTNNKILCENFYLLILLTSIIFNKKLQKSNALQLHNKNKIVT